MLIGAFDLVTILVLFPAVLACFYYWFLAIYAFYGKEKRNAIKDESIHSFAIIIPAHNEGSVITETLKSCAQIDYPSNKFQVFVIADNCTDNTAEIARNNGVICYERQDDVNIGKGFALSWAFEHVLPKKFDGLIVIDADCSVDAHALREFDQRFKDGDSVLQANDVASNPDASPMSYAVAVGNLIENDLFYAPKSRLGLAVFLRGTGMVFHRDILLRFPWKAHSIVEDVEYTLNLLRHNIPVRFVQNVKVRSAFPVTQEQLNVQRTRWASGNLNFGKKHVLKLILEGVHQRKLVISDAGFTFLILSRPLLLAQIVSALIISGISWWTTGSIITASLFIVAGSIFFLLSAYLGLGIIFLGITRHRLLLLLHVPLVVLRLFVIAILSLLGANEIRWEKTPRS